MKTTLLLILTASIFYACNNHTNTTIPTITEKSSIVGTWKLIKGIVIEKGDTTVTDYTKNKSFIKVINDSHFAFLLHDVNSNKDSLKTFSAGGGSYTLKDSAYTEHLEYCSDRSWEGHDFSFTISLQNDTLTQSGIEKIESTGINRLNTEIYVKMK